MSDRPPARLEDRQVPLWQAALGAGRQRLARRHATRVTQQPHSRVMPAAVRRYWKDAARDLAAAGAVVLLLVQVLGVAAQIPPSSQWPSPASPPVQICGNSSVLDGPSSPPAGAVTVPAGDNSSLFDSPLAANTTYWFAPGTHTFTAGTYGAFSSIPVENNDVLTGGPGAIIDGENFNYEAVDNPSASDVTIEYLTFQNFHTPGGQGAVYGYTGYTVEYDTIQDTIPGSGLYLGSDDVAEYNCLTENGQQGFGAYGTQDTSSLTGGVQNVTVDYNEISYNNQCNWEDFAGFPITPPAGCAGAGQFSGCGCAGAGKFWETYVSYFEGNYVHNDYDNGPWWDTDNTGMTVTGNYIAGEYGAGVTMEIGYNGYIADNTFIDDTWGVGPINPGFPTSAIYINASGSDSRVSGPYGSGFDITGNSFINDWSGVVLYETADRFCGSIANTSTGDCTLVNPSANIRTCGQPTPVSPSAPAGPAGPAPGRGRTGTSRGAPARAGRGGRAAGQNFTPLIDYQPYYSDCRWKTQNVSVTGNLFAYDPSDIPDCTVALYCGFNGLFSNYGITPPYLGYAVANTITYSQNNLFSGNTYCGPWQFDPYIQGSDETFATWQASPYNQDPGSTLNSAACSAIMQQTAGRSAGPAPVTIPVRIGRK